MLKEEMMETLEEAYDAHFTNKQEYIAIKKNNDLVKNTQDIIQHSGSSFFNELRDDKVMSGDAGKKN